MSEPKWMTLAHAELGTREIKGAEDNDAIVQYFADAGFPEIDDDETAWCAAFVGAMLERSGTPSAKSLAARSYLQWGKKVTKPYPGCVVVFSRGGRRSWQGHVAFYIGEDNGKIQVLGGNQRNKVSIASYSKDRLLGFRKPVSVGNSRTAIASVVGAGSTALGAAANHSDTLLSTSSELKMLGGFMPEVAVIGSVVALIAFGLVMYARQNDLEEKGK